MEMMETGGAKKVEKRNRVKREQDKSQKQRLM